MSILGCAQTIMVSSPPPRLVGCCVNSTTHAAVSTRHAITDAFLTKCFPMASFNVTCPLWDRSATNAGQKLSCWYSTPPCCETCCECKIFNLTGCPKGLPLDVWPVAIQWVISVAFALHPVTAQSRNPFHYRTVTGVTSYGMCYKLCKSRDIIITCLE